MNPPCRILLVEDDHAEAAAIERACCPDPSAATFDVVNNGAQAEDALLDTEYDLIVCDLALPADGRLLEPRHGRRTASISVDPGALAGYAGHRAVGSRGPAHDADLFPGESDR